jgi:hypothetical protein
MHATTRHDEMAFDSHDELAIPLASAASMRYFRKIPSATSYAQKPRVAYSTN